MAAEDEDASVVAPSMALILLTRELVSDTGRAPEMMTRAGMLFLTVVSVLTYSTCASAAVFEIQHLTPDTTKPATRLHAPESRMESLYKAASFDGRGDPHSSPIRMGPGKPEDLLWMTIGEAGVFTFQTLSSDTDVSLYLSQADRFLIQKTAHNGAIRAPAEGGVPQIWTIILIGAGLIWAQLRRKPRHSAIRFNPL